MLKSIKIKMGKEYCKGGGVFMASVCSAYAFTADFTVNNIEDGFRNGQLCIYKFLSCFNSVLDGHEVLFTVSPFITGFIGDLLKDVIYSTFCFVFIIFLVLYIDNNKKMNMVNMVGLILSAALVALTRNNGKEVVFPVLFTIVVITLVRDRKNRKQVVMAFTVFLLPIILSSIVSKSLQAHYEIADGSISEALSLPFQQTARTVLEHGDEIPVEEKDIIDRVLEYDALSEKYDPLISDPVKSVFRLGTTGIQDYVKVWLKQLGRYPMTYCESVLNQNFPMFCVLDNKQSYQHSSQVIYEEKEIIYEYPSLEKIEWVFDAIYKILNKLLVINFLSNTSFWCVMLIILFTFVLKSKEYDFLLVCFPLWLTIVSILLGPVFSPRYAYPVAYNMPFVIGYYTLRNCREEKDRNEKCNEGAV